MEDRSSNLEFFSSPTIKVFLRMLKWLERPIAEYDINLAHLNLSRIADISSNLNVQGNLWKGFSPKK
jgi:hypothetical protein